MLLLAFFLCLYDRLTTPVGSVAQRFKKIKRLVAWYTQMAIPVLHAFKGIPIAEVNACPYTPACVRALRSVSPVYTATTVANLRQAYWEQGDDLFQPNAVVTPAEALMALTVQELVRETDTRTEEEEEKLFHLVVVLIESFVILDLAVNSQGTAFITTGTSPGDG